MTTRGSARAWLAAQGTPLSAVGEFGLIGRLHALIERQPPGSAAARGFVTHGVGDDAAVLSPRAGHQLLVTCDIQVEGQHFIRGWIPPRDLGARCAAVNLSDIAAMGGTPRGALVSLLLDPSTAVEDVEEIYLGLLAALSEHDATIIGGNVSAAAAGLGIDVTMLGEIETDQALLRTGADAGDIVWATGAPGSAGAGYLLLKAHGPERVEREFQGLASAYLAPAARVREGRALRASGAVTAMIDMSDGLAGDARHLVETQPLDVLIREESLPFGEDLAQAARTLDRTPLSILLGPSDDYELLFTTPPSKGEEALRALREASDVPAWPIGEILGSGQGRVLAEDPDGARRALPAGGWNHFEEERP
jgi:thiamine-monophosphate kinase